jgi:hypothetical protein
MFKVKMGWEFELFLSGKKRELSLTVSSTRTESKLVLLSSLPDAKSVVEAYLHE